MPRNNNSGGKITVGLCLPSDIIVWLDRMAAAHKLPDRSKALRCCINCVAVGDLHLDTDDDDANASGKSDGGAAAGAHSAKEVEQPMELGSQQVDWLHQIANTTNNANKNNDADATAVVVALSPLVKQVVRVCMRTKNNENLVFGVVRCKSRLSECAGAQGVVERLQEQNGTFNLLPPSLLWHCWKISPQLEKKESQ